MLRRTRPQVALLIGALSALLVAACGGYTKGPERPKVVVLNIKGSKAVRGDIVEVLKASEYPLVPKREYIRTAKKLHARKLRARHITKVSGELGVSAVISGAIKKRGKRRYLYVTIHDGASGAKVERFRIRLSRKRALTKKGTEELEQRLTAALSELKPMSAGRDQSDAVAENDDPPKRKAKKKRKKKESRAERRRREKAEARERKRAEREERKREAAEKKAAERDRKRQERERAIAEKKRKERERKIAEQKRKEAERKRKERERKEAAEIKKITKPKTKDDGQAIDDESPF